MAVEGRFDNRGLGKANWLALAADTKPTAAQGAKVNDTLFTTDGKLTFVFTNSGWVQTT